MSSQRWFGLVIALGLALMGCLIVCATPAFSNGSRSTVAATDLVLFPDIADSFGLGVFELGIRNNGPDIAQNVVFRFTVPEGTRLDKFQCSVKSTCMLPPAFHSGEIVCAIGDLPASSGVHTSTILNVFASPGTRISIDARVSSDSPETNPANNVFPIDFNVPGFPRFDSVTVLKNPFRIQVTGQNLMIPQFAGTGLGVGCDCSRLAFEQVAPFPPDSFVIQGSNVKSLFPRGVPTNICYFDLLRGGTIKTTFTR